MGEGAFDGGEEHAVTPVWADAEVGHEVFAGVEEVAFSGGGEAGWGETLRCYAHEEVVVDGGVAGLVRPG